MILVPIKETAYAKQRLSTILTMEERIALARAMCHDVLQALAGWHNHPEVSVVTTDAFARELAGRYKFGVFADDNSGETNAIATATSQCKGGGAAFTLVIPADIPLISGEELQAILDAAPSIGSVLVPDAAGRGTNAALRSPADLFPLRFGNDSYLPHLSAAKATGLPCVTLQLPGIARDIDRPDDLYALAAAGGERHSQKLVRNWQLEERILVQSSGSS